MSNILVTGGAGYIGSHTSLALTQAGYEVVVADNLSTGVREAVLPPVRLVEGDLRDAGFVRDLLRRERVEGIIHFAASIVVPESVEKPLAYYRNNVGCTLNLVESAVAEGVKHFIFSSTAAVYGMPKERPITEEIQTNPINPYGRTKLADEWIIRDASAAHPGLKHTILRYFNVAGADPQGRLGQNTPDATHLIKVACQAALGMRKELVIFGNDYPTPDGTCIRDYIHVSDLTDIHVQALLRLEQGGESAIFNCGYGRGYSVAEVIKVVKEVSGVNFAVRKGPRRAGDPDDLVADTARMRAELAWTPAYCDLHGIVRSSLEWERRLMQR
ncbi:UDP-glucose 4-epimerase GalE [Desulfocurvibacter africanus]|uniref:UDP-glucose 4-epimerase GalE n=1 Tax=Desulfocurvibacter africanus TaxID=873 RepID=UPI002FD9EBC3